MIDAARYEFEEKQNDTLELNEDNLEEFINTINALQ